jgi:flavin-dependent dehydrogenase
VTDFVPASSTCREVDVVILGGGPAGSALALALKRAGVGDVVLVDRPAWRPFRIGESAAPGLASSLLRLGLNDRLDCSGHQPCHGNLFLWGGPTPVVEDFMNRANGPGWHLDREAFDAWLRAEAVTGGAELLSPAHLAAVRRDGDSWLVGIRGNGIDLAARTRWIVDATGRSAAFARRSGARLHRFDRLIALAVRVIPAEGRGFKGFSVIEAAEIGWWYAAGLPSGTAIVALMTDADIARRANLRSPSAFRQAWAATSEIEHFAPLSHSAMRPIVFAAGTQFIDRAIVPGWLALGDALIALDPLSAAGITGALEDAIAAADTIVRLLVLPGRGEARDVRSAYAARANATLSRYLVERGAIYGREKRWIKSSFWQRRVKSDACGSIV